MEYFLFDYGVVDKMYPGKFVISYAPISFVVNGNGLSYSFYFIYMFVKQVMRNDFLMQVIVCVVLFSIVEYHSSVYFEYINKAFTGLFPYLRIVFYLFGGFQVGR